MTPRRIGVPATWLPSLLAGLTTWVTLLAWSAFAERPSGYLVPILGGCLIVAVTGMLLRSARVPAILVALAQLVIVMVWLNHRLAPELMPGGWIPTVESVRAMFTAFHDASIAAQSYAAPVPRSVPEFYPLMILTGSLAAVAIDFLAVGLRRAPLAGLPLLALYTAPVSILDGGVSWLKFAAAALCFLFLIAAEEAQRLAHWGHQLTSDGPFFDTQTTSVNRQAVWSSARKIGLTATGLAVVVPIFVPTFTGTLFGGGNGDGDGDGDSVSISNPMVDLRRDLTQGEDVELVRVTTTDENPSYLRLSVLNSFDGSAWRPSGRSIPVKQRANGDIPRPPGLEASVPTQDVPSTVQVSEDFGSKWLPTPYPVAAVQAPGDWRYDRATMDFISAADDQTTAGMTYRLRELQLSPSAATLARAVAAPTSVFTPNTSLPRDLPESVRRLARSVTDGRGSKFEQAVALQEWFRVDGGFTYSLERSPGNGTDDLVTFLGTGEGGRVGYCEQFAAAMAVMGRSIGIPSRVAVGFLRPDPVAKDTYVYSSHDLHAWPEMYFSGVGWVRFEPTPQDRASDVPGYTTQVIPRADPSASSSAPAAAPNINRFDQPVGPAGAGGANDQGSIFTRPLFLGLVGGGLLLVLMMLAPRALRELVRRRRWAGARDLSGLVEAAWAEIRDTARDLGVAWDDRVTVRTAAHDLQRSFAQPGGADDALTRTTQRGEGANPDASASLTRLVGLVERARYARDLPASAAATDQVHDDTTTCVEALRAGAGRRHRSRATWLPASLRTQLGATYWRSETRRGGIGLSEPGVDRAV